MRRAALLWFPVWLGLGPGCAAFDDISGFSDNAQTCVEINDQIADCLGQEFGPLVCNGISDMDLVALQSSLDAGGCEVLGGAIPIDGDIQASYCRLLDDGCVNASNASPDYVPTRYPVVLVNGIDVSPAFRYSQRILDVMRDQGGHDVHLAVDTPYETPARRAVVLWERIQEIRRETGAPKVNLICHSLGGLDCRYLVSPGGLHWDVDAGQDDIADAVASITTVSTAHRGTLAADAALGYLPDAEKTASIDALATFFGNWFTEDALDQDVHLRESVAALTTIQAAAFNAEIVDAPGVYYQSWGGFSRPFGVADEAHDIALVQLCATEEGDGLALFNGQHDYIATPLTVSSDIVGGENLDDGDSEASFVPNDGLCSVESARWGRFRGCVPADHMEQLGQRNIPDANVRTGVDIAFFYANIAEDLARRGF